ncbi:MAG: hypothetical protein IPK74_06900 [Deltaproteobacteria bacterium]|nr:hypothetical protein [Deltaproteobacteria bacterium]
MPTEHRLVAGLILLVGGVLCVLGLVSNVERIAVGAVVGVLVVAGILLPTPRLANGVTAVLAGSIIAGCAMASGGAGLVALGIPALASSVLLLGASGVGWGIALALASVFAHGLDPRMLPASGGTTLDAYALVLLIAWSVWILGGGVYHVARRVRAGVRVAMTGAIGLAAIATAMATSSAVPVVFAVMVLAVAHAHADSLALAVPPAERADRAAPRLVLVAHGRRDPPPSAA